MKNQVNTNSRRPRLLAFCVTLLFVACAGIIASAQLRQSGLMLHAPQQPAPAEKTVEQVRKNIRVLNGLPDSQLQPVMNFIAVSLGVKCTFCHVNKDGKWDFAADEKPEKATAREMIKMVQNLNKTNFGGNNEISCNTCHRGRSHPAGVITFPLPAPPVSSAPAAAPEAAAEAKPSATPQAPPTAEQILAKYAEALGGSGAIDKLKSRSMRGTWLTANGMSLGYEVYQTAPDKLFTVLITPKQGNFERGFDGKIAWEKSSRGLREIEGPELHYFKRYPDLFKDIKLKEQFTRLAFAGKDKIDDREVYVLRGTTADNKRERLFFDVQTGLLVRRITSTPTVVGVIPEQIDFADYREVDGMKLPFTISITSIDSFFNSIRKFTEIKLNVPVDETKFTKPAPAPVPAATP